MNVACNYGQNEAVNKIGNKSKMRFESGSFDPQKPTIIYFGNGDCIISQEEAEAWNGGDAWHERANVISFSYYEPDEISEEKDEPRTYYKCADMIIAFLSKEAPDYNQLIQTAGFSTGGQPAMDVAIYINRNSKKLGYSVCHVTLLDAFCRRYPESIKEFFESEDSGEQRWIDRYACTNKEIYSNVLNVRVMGDHVTPPLWYVNSLTVNDMNEFNNGVVAGAYWSVVGPGKNLQLESRSDNLNYFFEWQGTAESGTLDFYKEKRYPGKLPEPVTLIEPSAESTLNEGLLLTCERSENAVAYQILVGSDPNDVNHIVSETSEPPTKIITKLPPDARYWTIKVRDKYGSTIYAGPIPLPDK